MHSARRQLYLAPIFIDAYRLALPAGDASLRRCGGYAARTPHTGRFLQRSSRQPRSGSEIPRTVKMKATTRPHRGAAVIFGEPPRGRWIGTERVTQCSRRRNPLRLSVRPLFDSTVRAVVRRARLLARAIQNLPSRVELNPAVERQAVEHLGTQADPRNRVAVQIRVPNVEIDDVRTMYDVHLEREAVGKFARARERNLSLEACYRVNVGPGAQIDDSHGGTPRRREIRPVDPPLDDDGQIFA